MGGNLLLELRANCICLPIRSSHPFLHRLEHESLSVAPYRPRHSQWLCCGARQWGQARLNGKTRPRCARGRQCKSCQHPRTQNLQAKARGELHWLSPPVVVGQVCHSSFVTIADWNSGHTRPVLSHLCYSPRCRLASPHLIPPLPHSLRLPQLVFCWRQTLVPSAVLSMSYQLVLVVQAGLPVRLLIICVRSCLTSRSVQITALSGPNGNIDFLNCGLTSGGWTPPLIHISDIVGVELSQVAYNSGSTFSPCKDFVFLFEKYGRQYGGQFSPYHRFWTGH